MRTVLWRDDDDDDSDDDLNNHVRSTIASRFCRVADYRTSQCHRVGETASCDSPACHHDDDDDYNDPDPDHLADYSP